MLTAGLRHRPHPLLGADVARVDADLIYPLRRTAQGQAVVEVDIRHQRDVNGLFDLPDGGGGLHGGYGHADDLAARALQPQDLGHGGGHILGGGAAHGLNGHRCAAADDHAADVHLLAHSQPFFQVNSFHTSLKVTSAISASSSTSPAKWI